MAHHIDWDNIHLHIYDNDVRYKRRLRRKQLYIDCSPSITNVSPAPGSLKKLKSVKDQIFKGNDELVVACPNVVSDPKPIRVRFGCKRNDVDSFKEGFTEGGKSLVCKVEDNASDDVNLMELENVQDLKFLCNDVHTDLEMIKEGLGGGGKSLVCKIDDNASDEDNSMKLENVQDRKFMCNDELEVACPNVVFDPKPIRVISGGKKNDTDPAVEMFKEGLREGGQFLVCKVEDNDSDDVSLKKLENVQDKKLLCNDEFWVECSNVVGYPEPIGVICGTGGDAVGPDLKMFKGDLKEERHLFASSDTGIKKLGNVQDQDKQNDELRVNCRDRDVKFGAKRMIVDPDLKKFLEDLKVDGHSFGLKVKKSDGSSVSVKYEKDELGMKYQRKIKGDDRDVKFGAKKMIVDPDSKKFSKDLKVDGHSYGSNVKNSDGSLVSLKYEEYELGMKDRRKLKGDDVKYVLEKQKGDNSKKLRNDMKKEERDKVGSRGDVNFVSTKEKRNVMLQREGFSGNSKRYPVTERSSVVKSRDNMEIISMGKPNEIEGVTISKNDRPSKIIRNKRQRPLNLDDGCNIEHLRKSKSKKQYEKVERRTCLARTDHVSNLMDITGKSKRHYRRTSPRDLVVQQGKDIENLRSSSGIGNMDVIVKEEKFDDSTNVVVKKRRQMIQGRDSVHDNNLRPLCKCDEKFGKYLEVKKENANSLNYNEEDNEQSSDLEILEMDNQQILSKFEVRKVFNASFVEDNPLSIKSPSDYENPEFRRGLMDILRRPFNLEEYRSLMQKAKYRHLMGSPEYSDGLKGKGVTNTYGKSPLDYHPGVQRRLRQCRKISKRLNILRGFIYWYGRTCQDGAFKPWLDKSCSAITPCFR